MIDKIKPFETREVRTLWDAGQAKCYFNIVDVLAVLTERAGECLLGLLTAEIRSVQLG